MTKPETEILETRRKLLAPWLTKASYNDTRPIISAMFLSFASRKTTQDEAAAIGMQYSYALGSLPGWAIKRACDRFATAAVQPEEIGEKRIDRSFPPSSPHIAMVAERLVQPVRLEYRRIDAILRGVAPARPLTEAERTASRAVIEAMVDDYKAQVAGGELLSQAEDTRRSAALRDSRERNLEARRAEYVAAGLPAPKGEMFMTLPLLLSAGWTIQDGPNGTRELVAPARAERSQRATSTAGMGS